jgi:hypothetical protein
MPDLAKIMPLLKTTPFDKAALIKALEANAVNVHADVAKQKAAIAKSATPTASGAAAPWIHDPYTIWDEQNKKWNDMPLNSDQDVFN